MGALTFKVVQGYCIDISKKMPVNNDELEKFKRNISLQLSEYIDRINSAGAYVEITVEQDGETFSSRLLGCKDPDLFAEIMDR
jgi:hypothetical protein